MSYINNPSITLADSPNVDAFQRLRIGSPDTVFDNKQIYGDNTLIWSTLVTGNATSSFLSNNSCMLLTASGSNSSVIRQTRRRHAYQPGKSQLIICTGNFNQMPAANVVKRIGYFDQNNGIGFMASGSSFGVFLRSNTSGTPTNTFISQSSWNLDHYDGTGTSGNSLNITSSQIYFMDFEWLGVGRVRYGIFQGGIPTYVHQITNINALNTVFMSSPNQPIRYEIVNSGSTPQSLSHICSTVVSEGGLATNLGQVKAVSNLYNGAVANGVYCGLIALRLNSSSLDGVVVPLEISTIQTTSGGVYEVNLQLNPSGSLPWVWQSYSGSVVQWATGSNTFTIATEGSKISSFVSAGTNQLSNIDIDNNFSLGSDVTGSQDILVLGYHELAGNAGNVCATLTWREI